MYYINWIKILMVAALALIILAGTSVAASLLNSGCEHGKTSARCQNVILENNHDY